MHAGKPGTNSVWFTWTAPATGIATFRTTGSTFDTLLAIYTGTNVGALTEVASDEDRGGFLASQASFNATGGTVYRIAIAGFNGAQGSFVLRWEFVATNATLPVVTCPPANRTVLAGQSASFTVSATGAGLTYQWLFNGTAISGATNAAYTRTNVQSAEVGFYSVRVANGAGQSVESLAAILEIGPFPTLQSRDKPDDVYVTCPGGGNFLAPASVFNSVAVGVDWVSRPRQLLHEQHHRLRDDELRRHPARHALSRTHGGRRGHVRHRHRRQRRAHENLDLPQGHGQHRPHAHLPQV